MRRNDPNSLLGFRTPCRDLDYVYGRGPYDQPQMSEVKGKVVKTAIKLNLFGVLLVNMLAQPLRGGFSVSKSPIYLKGQI